MSLVTAVLALIFSLLLMVVPVPTFSSSYVWDPTDASESGEFRLSSSWPNLMVIESSCEKLNASMNVSVLDFGSHRLDKTDAQIQLVDSKTNQILLSSTLEAGSCAFGFTYVADANKAVFTVDGLVQEEYVFKSNEKIYVDRLLLPIGQEPPISNLEITTRPNFSKDSFPRSMFLLFSVLLITISLGFNKKFISRRETL